LTGPGGGGGVREKTYLLTGHAKVYIDTHGKRHVNRVGK